MTVSGRERGGEQTHKSNLRAQSPVHDAKHCIPNKRPQQPSHGARSRGGQSEHDEWVKAEDAAAQGLDVLLANDRDTARGGAERGDDRGDQVVVAAGASELEVFVPGEGGGVWGQRG